MAAAPSDQLIESKLVSLKKLWDEQEKLYQTINKIQSKLSRVSIKTVEKFDDKFWNRLIILNEKARTLAEKEATLCLEIEDSMRNPASQKLDSNSSNTVLNISPNKSERPQVPSSEFSEKGFPCSVILVGDEVAAKVSSESDDTDVWIVVRVIKVAEEALLFHVCDETPDDAEGHGKTAIMREYVLPQTCILPFQREANGNNAALFLPGSRVLAIYPGTSTLYKASVVGRHPADSSQDHHYLVQFDGDEEDLGEVVDKLRVWKVSFDGIVPLLERHRQ